VRRDTETDTVIYVGTHYEKHIPLQDLNNDCDIDIVDIMLVASRWNTSVGDPDYDPAYDLDGDGDIDIVDIMKVAAAWGVTKRSTSWKVMVLGGRSPTVSTNCWRS
jgi:hypothetical protein